MQRYYFLFKPAINLRFSNGYMVVGRPKTEDRSKKHTAPLSGGAGVGFLFSAEG